MFRTLLVLPLLVFAQQCTPQNGPTVCRTLGPAAQCLLTSGGSNPTGYCWIPGTPTSSVLPGQTNGENGVSCGNSTITFQCKLGQLCVNQTCTGVDEATKAFFTPLVIGLIVGGSVLLLLGSCLLCFCCRCCCFAGRKLAAGRGKIVSTPFKGRQQGSKSSPVVFRQKPGPAPMNGSNQTLNNPHVDSNLKATGPAPLSENINSNRTPQLFHVEEYVEIIPVLPSEPPPKLYSATAYPKNELDLPYSSPASPYNVYHVASPHPEASPKTNNGVYQKDPMYPENYSLSIHAPINQDSYSGDERSQEIYALKPNMLNSLQSSMRENSGPIVSQSKVPPPSEGFFGFWDRKGNFHQGYTDRDLNIHGGVFDDQCYFHFGVVGSEEAVYVEESMMANPVEISISPISDHPDEHVREIANTGFINRVDIQSYPAASSPNLHPTQEEIPREGGESMDVFACSVQSPRYI